MPRRERTHEPRRLTKRSVDAAKPEAAEYVLWDTEISGFGLRVSPTGRKTFVLKYRTAAGDVRKRRIGRYGDITPDEARQIAKNWHGAIAKGGDPGAQQDALKRSTSFKQLADLFIEGYAKPRKRSWKEDERILNRYFAAWHGRKANAIEPREIADRLESVKTANGPVMANRARACLSKLYAWAAQPSRLPDIKHNPVRDVEPPGREAERERVYREQEIRDLWAAFNTLGKIGRIYKLYLVTMLRRSEVSNAEWSEIEGNVWTIPGARMKNKRPHVVPLSELALEILEEQRGQNERWIFPSAVRRDQPVRGLSQAADDVKKVVADFRAHDLRRTAATETTKLGFSRFVVDRCLAHTEPGVGRRYDRHDYLKEKRDALGAWARRLSNILEGGKVVQLARKD